MRKMPETTDQNLLAGCRSRVMRWQQRFKLFILVVGCIAITLTVFFGSHIPALSNDSAKATPRAGYALTEAQEQGRDFSKFSHSDTHAALPCLLCHRRENNQARPALPGHQSCAGCHAQRFNDSANPICTVCHTNAQAGAVKPFPSLRSFNMKFDHARHMSGAARPAATCVACHKPQARGVGLSIPSGTSAHVTCFQCHGPQAANSTGRDISSCGTCHQSGRLARTPEWARSYRINFSHAEHGRRGLSCNDCHNVRAGLPQGRQVTAPQPLMHHASARAASCMTCHNDRRAFGISDFANCNRCHEGQTYRF
jgi:c(7)-type cytochrome triheme protein